MLKKDCSFFYLGGNRVTNILACPLGVNCLVNFLISCVSCTFDQWHCFGLQSLGNNLSLTVSDVTIQCIFCEIRLNLYVYQWNNDLLDKLHFCYRSDLFSNMQLASSLPPSKIACPLNFYKDKWNHMLHHLENGRVVANQDIIRSSLDFCLNVKFGVSPLLDYLKYMPALCSSM